MTAVPYQETSHRRPDPRRRTRIEIETIRATDLRPGDVARRAGYNDSWQLVLGVYTATSLNQIPERDRGRFRHAEPGHVIVAFQPRAHVAMDMGELMRSHGPGAVGPDYKVTDQYLLFEAQFCVEFWPYPEMIDRELPRELYVDEDDEPEPRWRSVRGGRVYIPPLADDEGGRRGD